MILEIMLFVWLIIVIIAVVAILKHYNLLYPTPSLDLEKQQVLYQHMLSVLQNARCPLCNSITHVASIYVTLRDTPTAVLKCDNSECQQKSIWEYEKNKWTLKAPYKFSFTPKTVVHVPITNPVDTTEKTDEVALNFV